MFKEANTGIIDLSEDDPEAVELMVNCMTTPKELLHVPANVLT
jgi:hypothetical protein